MESKYNLLLPFAKTPADRQTLLLLLTNEKKETGAKDIVEIAKHIQSLTPVQETELERITGLIEIAKYLTPAPKGPSEKMIRGHLQEITDLYTKSMEEREKNRAAFEAEMTKIKANRERDRVETLWKIYTNPNLPKKSVEEKLRYAAYLLTPVIKTLEPILEKVARNPRPFKACGTETSK